MDTILPAELQRRKLILDTQTASLRYRITALIMNSGNADECFAYNEVLDSLIFGYDCFNLFLSTYIDMFLDNDSFLYDSVYFHIQQLFSDYQDMLDKILESLNLDRDFSSQRWISNGCS